MRLRKDISKLLIHLEKPVIGLLQAHNLITRGSKKLSTAELTPEAKVMLGDDEELITDEWIQNWRKLWPTRQKGDLNVIRKKLNRFVQEEDVDLNTITKATESWIASQSEDKYAGKANNFFYLQNKDGSIISRCAQELEIMGDSPPEDTELFGGNLLDDY